MQSANTVLEVLRDRGRRKLPLERLYRQLFNEQLFLVAYGRVYANDGAMTPGADGKTPDGMSLDTIREIIDRLRAERYRFTEVISARIRQVPMLELGEDKSSADDVSSVARVGGDVAEAAPATDEQCEAAFAEAP
jgi:hypothetical protein